MICSELHQQALYVVQDRRHNGAWRSVAETSDPRQANALAAVLAFYGATTRVELVPQPIVP
jgi:hypothetical protein